MPVTDPAIKFSFLTELHLILNDFEKVLEYVDSSDENLTTFSHRIYELLLRTCTAFETVSKSILNDQGYTLPKGKQNTNIEDYYTLSSPYRLNEYKVLFNAWRSGAKEIAPFEEWNTVNYIPLPWYQAYNHSKHDRHQNFKEANLGILLESIAGLFALLYAVYGNDVFGKYQDNEMYQSDSETDYIWVLDSMFSIKPPQ